MVCSNLLLAFSLFMLSLSQLHLPTQSVVSNFQRSIPSFFFYNKNTATTGKTQLASCQYTNTHKKLTLLVELANLLLLYLGQKEWSLI